MQPEEPGIQQAFSPGFFQPQEVSASGCECATFTRNVKVKVSQSCLTLSPHELYSPWNSPGQNTGMGSHSLLQGIFPTQGSNSGLPHCRRILYQLSRQGSSRNTEVGSLSLLRWVFWTQESNRGLLHCRQILYPPSYEGTPSNSPGSTLGACMQQEHINKDKPIQRYLTLEALLSQEPWVGGAVI